MATFPSVTPTYQGFSKKSAPAVRTVRFADGFEQRIFFGLASNQNPKVYNVSFELSETESDVVEAFLDSRANDQESFTFTPPGEGFTKTGTYVQSGTTITITIANHGVAIGDVLTIDFTSGATDGSYTVATAVDANTFTVTAAASATITSTAVSVTLSGAKKFVCETWSKSIPYNNRASISATFRQVFEA
jgi:phage-related protein